MIEVIVSTALLLVVTLGFITAAAAGGKALLEGMKLENSWTEEELLAEEGKSERKPPEGVFHHRGPGGRRYHGGC